MELKQTNLELNYLKKEGVSSKNGKPYCFYELYVIVNGISIKVLPLVGDETGKMLITAYLQTLDD
ncbi:unknown [Staphylococcus sp. CAG:324]|nr:unknown [Staphylococcus sp. CAG:324]